MTKNDFFNILLLIINFMFHFHIYYFHIMLDFTIICILYWVEKMTRENEYFFLLEKIIYK